jgi:hypothetical protein
MTAPEPQDPFEHFGEQEQSWSALGKYRDHVLALARQVFADHGEAIGGLILCPGSQLGRILAQHAPAAQRPDPDRQTCVTGMPRADFDQFVKLHAPELAEALPEADPAWLRSGRSLPILVATANGHRLGCVRWDAADPPDHST